jgi:hypothetical protein
VNRVYDSLESHARCCRRNICYGMEAEDGLEAAPGQEEVEAAAKLANAVR